MVYIQNGLSNLATFFVCDFLHVITKLVSFLQISRSSAQVVHLRTSHWTTAGSFRCEVTADDFETASKSVEATVVGNNNDLDRCYIQ
jgi:hypothetical protein